MNVKGTERKVLTEGFPFFFFFLVFKERQFTFLQGVKTAQLVIVRAAVGEIMIV